MSNEKRSAEEWSAYAKRWFAVGGTYKDLSEIFAAAMAQARGAGRREERERIADFLRERSYKNLSAEIRALADKDGGSSGD